MNDTGYLQQRTSASISTQGLGIVNGPNAQRSSADQCESHVAYSGSCRVSVGNAWEIAGEHPKGKEMCRVSSIVFADLDGYGYEVGIVPPLETAQKVASVSLTMD